MDPEAAAERGLLSERIRDALTDEITSGGLRAGTPLDEQQLANRFGASRTPVREALRQLAVGGLVEMRPRRGVVVTRFTPDRIMDLFEANAEIEAMCVRLATYRISPLERSRLTDMHATSVEAVRTADFDAYDAFNQSFHRLIYAATRNTYLEEEAFAVRNRLAAFRRAQLRHKDRLSESSLEHGQILRAMAEGDGNAAAGCMRAHMLNASSALEKYIAEHAGPMNHRPLSSALLNGSPLVPDVEATRRA